MRIVIPERWVFEAKVDQAGNIDKYKCNKQCFTLYCCLSEPKFPPLFPWSLDAMCRNFIMYTFQKSKDLSIPTAMHRIVLGSWSWNGESGYWHSQKTPGDWCSRVHCEASNQSPNIPGCPGTQSDTRRSLTDMGADYLEDIHFGRFSPFFFTELQALVELQWKARRSQIPQWKCHWISEKSTWHFTEVEKSDSTTRSDVVGSSNFFGLANCMILGILGEYLSCLAANYCVQEEPPIDPWHASVYRSSKD